MLSFLRSCVYLVLVVLATIVCATAIIVMTPFSSALQRYRVAYQWLRFVNWVARYVLGIRLRVSGTEHFPADPNSKVVVLSKHQSAWETLALPQLLPQATAFVFKRELSWIPFFGWGLTLCGTIRINRALRTQAIQQVIAQGRLYIENERRWIVIFPEGTRVPRFQKGRYKAGGAHLATVVGASVLPVALSSAKVWPRNRFVKYPGTVDVVFGPLIPTAGKSAHAITAEAEQWIEATMQVIDPSPTAQQA